MKIKICKQKTKDTFYTLVPLNWLLKIFNLSCIYRKQNQLKVSWSLNKSIIYIFLLGFVNFFFLVNKIKRFDVHRSNAFVKFTDILQMFYLIGYFEYIIDLYHVYKYGRDSYLKYFKIFDHVDQILGMTYYDEIRKIILRTVGLCMIIFVTCSILDFASLVLSFGLIDPILFSLDYFYFLLNTLTVLDVMSHVVQLEYRLKMMKDHLQEYYYSTNCKTSIPADEKTWAAGIETTSKRLQSLKTLCHGRFIEVIGFNRCYLLLLEQTYYINAMFGVRVLIFCINLLISMISMLNVSIRIANGSLVTPYGKSVLPAVSSMTKMLNWALVAIIMVYRCEQSSRQSESILAIIDLVLVNKNNTKDLTTILVDLRNLLLTRPIKFHAVHFFTIDYTILVSVSSAVVTYTIILLQNMQ